MKMLIDTHTHTIVSGHAYSTVEENVRHASKNGIELLAITDHAPYLPGGPSDIYFMNFGVIPKKMNGVELFMGVELNILDFNGKIDLEEHVIKKLDLVIASLHPMCIEPGTIEENTNAITKAMENPLIQIIGHPGDPKYPLNMKKVVESSKRTGTILEVNNASLNPEGSRGGSESAIIEMLELCKANNVSVIVGSDAHFSTQIGGFYYVEELFERIKFPKALVLNTNINKFKEYLKK